MTRQPDAVLRATAVLVWALFVAAVYLPHVGRGFVQDDFAWIEAARAGLGRPLSILLPQAPNFYRPVVSVSFVLDYRLSGLSTRAYGCSNILLYAACAGALLWLLRTTGVSPAAATLAALAWALNPHGIAMAVVWISGRTSLLLTLFALLAAIAFLRGHRLAGMVLVLAALLSKEEAVLLPVMVAAVAWSCRPGDRQGRIRDAAATAIALAAYALLRAQTPAFTPATAPPYYRLTAAPGVVLANALEYLDRGATVFLVLVVIAACAYRALPKMALARRLATAGAVWFVAGYAITVFLPFRSDLYAVLPSAGAAIACAAAIDGMRPKPSTRADYRMAAGVAALLLLIPVYRARDRRYVEPARVSSRAMHAVARDAAALPAHGMILFVDEPVPYANFRSAFGTLATDAVRLYADHDLSALVVPAGTHGAAAHSRPIVSTYQLEHGRVIRVE